MEKKCLICVITLLFSSLSFAVTEVQTSWYLGPVEPGPVSSWDEKFSSSEHIAYTLPGALVLESQDIHYDGWVKHVLLNDARIDGHATLLPADIDGDGLLDIVGIMNSYPDGDNVLWFQRGPGGTYTTRIVGTYNTGYGGWYTSWPFDMDGDGDFDVVVSAGTPGLGWFENDGSGGFNLHMIDDTTSYVYARPGDMDNDGDVDIVARSQFFPGSEGRLVWFENDGTMNFRGPFPISNNPIVWRINLADFNNDGRLDIQTSGDGVCVFLNSPSGLPIFTQVFCYASEFSDGSWPADFDRDGDIDILFSDWSSEMYWLENTGGNYDNWPRHDISINSYGRYSDGSMAIDLDIDGVMDALGALTALGWYDQSASSPTFTEHRLGDLWNSHWVYGANLDEDQCQPDFSGDVDIDILVADSNEFDWWENRMVTFYDSGRLESSILSPTSCNCWRTFGWQDCVPEGSSVYYKVRASDDLDDLLNDSVPWSSPILSSGDLLSGYGVSPGTYFQYRIEFERGSADASRSPGVLEVSLDYDLSVSPVITSPAPITLECNQPGGVSKEDPAIQTWLESVEAIGGCDGQALPVTNDAPASFPSGCAPGTETSVTFEAQNECADVFTGTSTITVVDTTAPVLSGVPSNVTVECDSVPPPAVPTATDICDANVNIAFSEVRTDGDCPENYTLTRTWVATDNCGISTAATQVITVRDTIAPVLSGVPASVTVECDSVPPPAVPTAVDNCDAYVDIAFSETRTDGDCPYDYTLTRTWTATDNCGNFSLQTQVLTVQDTTPPQLTCAFEPVLDDEDTDEDSDEYVDGLFTVRYSGTDNCDANPTVSGYLDLYGNDETCDDEDPDFIGFPVDDGDRVRINCSKKVGDCVDEASDVVLEITGPAMRLIVTGEDVCFNRSRTECIYRCPEPEGCIDAITLKNSAGEQKTFYWYEFTGPDMIFDVGGETGKFHVSCSKCLRVGDVSGTLTITCIQGGSKLEKKCKVPGGTFSAPCP